MPRIILADNLDVLRDLPDGHADLIYIDPPFNTGKTQQRTRIETRRAAGGGEGDRTGFKGERYETTVLGTRRFADRFDDYLGFLGPRLIEAYRVLAPHGSFYLHVDYREVHHCRLFLDDLFGPDHLLNEIIWGVRLRRAAPDPMAGEARQHPLLREGPVELRVQRGRDRAHPVHGAGTGGTGEGRARQAAHGYVVAHDRPHERRRADGLSDPEAARHPPPHHHGLLEPRRPRARLLRGQRHDRHGRPRTGTATDNCSSTTTPKHSR